jgi:hypothetical protein
VSRYGRLRDQYFGDFKVLGVNKATATAISVRCAGSRDKQAELKFKIEPTLPFRVSGLEIFIVDFDQR